MDSDERRREGTRLPPETARPPQPEGPDEVYKKFEDLNRRPPWDVLGHAADLAGKLDLKTGTAVVAIAEVLNVLAGDFVEGTLDLPFSGWLTFLLPLLLGFFHRKEKSKGPTASGGSGTETGTPEDIAATVESSERSVLPRSWKRSLSP